ncbi:MAG TPA: carboxyl transferase domain-containing protein [Actinomycetota bacterium]|nr:carboxyl transferase domain-containing protein [Actinomycetota bacterium]
MPETGPEAIETIADAGSFEAAGALVSDADPVGYPTYRDALERARERSGSREAVLAGSASIGGVPVEVAALDFSFMGGSMGSAAGELLARSLERAAARRVPFVLRTATGGARMQEGMASLVQMPKIVGARVELARAGLPFVAVLGHPTTGGVLASLASLADVTIAEEGATVGFAGPRVVERATGRRLAEGSHTAESALAAGLVDAVVPGADVRASAAAALSIFASEPGRPPGPPPEADGAGRDPWESLQRVRSESWPRGPDLARGLSGSFFELRGDRAGADDRACVTGLATVEGAAVVLLALDRARAPGPSAYRKATRCIRMAARLGLPVVTLVDTGGADPSETSEAGGIAWAISELFEAMLSAPVPVVSVLTGEGGSGGALAFACGDVLLAYEDAVFAVIAPELAAEILWREPARAPEAARLLKMGSGDLLRLGICDAVLGGRPSGGSLRAAVAYHLARLGNETAGAARDAARRQRWRHVCG